MRHAAETALDTRLDSALPPSERRLHVAWHEWQSAGHELKRIATSDGKRDLAAWKRAAQAELKARARLARVADRL